MRFSRTLSLLILAAALALLATACPQSGGSGSTNGTTSTSTAQPASGGGTATPAEPASITEPIVSSGPDFTFTTFDGAEHKLSEYRGKPVVVNFFGVT